MRKAGPGITMVLRNTQAMFLVFPFKGEDNKGYGVNTILLLCLKFNIRVFVHF